MPLLQLLFVRQARQEGVGALLFLYGEVHCVAHALDLDRESAIEARSKLGRFLADGLESNGVGRGSRSRHQREIISLLLCPI